MTLICHLSTPVSHTTTISETTYSETWLDSIGAYYPEAKEFMGEVKTINYAEYREMAKSFSHRLRNEIKESYEAFHNGSLDGITFTRDNQHYVKTVIVVELDKMPILRRQRK